jgi:hypothetical protein
VVIAADGGIHHRAALLVGQADNEMKLWWRAGEG